jgi:hypothetical protein
VNVDSCYRVRHISLSDGSGERTEKTTTHRLVLRPSRRKETSTLTDSHVHSGSGLLSDSTAPKRLRPQPPPAFCQNKTSQKKIFITSDAPKDHSGLLTRAVQ